MVRNVQMGVLGGQTKWNLYTYDRELVGGQPQDATDLRDQRLNIDGFRMPGRLSIVPGSMLLESRYQQDPAVYPTESLFPARANEDNFAELFFTVSQTVKAQTSYLRVRCEASSNC